MGRIVVSTNLPLGSPGAGIEPAGAYSARSFSGLAYGPAQGRRGLLAPGHPQWLPLGQVEPFASAIAKAGIAAAVAVAVQPLPPGVPPRAAAAGPGKKPASRRGSSGPSAVALPLPCVRRGLRASSCWREAQHRTPSVTCPENLKLLASVDVAAVRNSKAYSDLAQALGPTIDTAEQDIKNTGHHAGPI